MLTWGICWHLNSLTFSNIQGIHSGLSSNITSKSSSLTTLYTKYSPIKVFQTYSERSLSRFTFSSTCILLNYLVYLFMYHDFLPVQHNMGAGSISVYPAPPTVTFIMFLDCVGQVFMSFILGDSHELVFRCYLKAEQGWKTYSQWITQQQRVGAGF